MTPLDNAGNAESLRCVPVLETKIAPQLIFLSKTELGCHVATDLVKHSGFNPDSVIEASFEVLSAVSEIMTKVRLFHVGS